MYHILIVNILASIFFPPGSHLTGSAGRRKLPRACIHTIGARCSSVVRAFAHGAMGCQIDPSWGGPIELFLVPASAPRLV